MIPYANIKTSPPSFFDEYEIGDEDIARFLDMSDEGAVQEAVDVFVDEFLVPPGTRYQNILIKYLRYAESGPLRDRDEKKISRSIIVLGIGLSALLLANFKKFSVVVYSPKVFTDSGLDNAIVKNSILNEVLSKYEGAVSGAMSQTQAFVRSGIRSLQREMITENARIRNFKVLGKSLDLEVKMFKDRLLQKYPDLYKAMEEGKVLMSRKFGPENEMIRHYKLDSYIDMTTRTTLLNIDRTANTIMAMVDDEKAVEFFLSDPRQVKQDREICQHILQIKTFGKSVLATDEESARTLGVMTVDEAQSTPDYAFGPYCRHSVRRCDKNYLTEINKRLGAE